MILKNIFIDFHKSGSSISMNLEENKVQNQFINFDMRNRRNVLLGKVVLHLSRRCLICNSLK